MKRLIAIFDFYYRPKRWKGAQLFGYNNLWVHVHYPYCRAVSILRQKNPSRVNVLKWHQYPTQFRNQVRHNQWTAI